MRSIRETLGGWLPSLLVLMGLGVVPAARADNVITYNFNSQNGSEEGWYPTASGTVPPWMWNLQPSDIGGGWQVFSGSNSANSGSYLTSPCMVIDNNQDWVNVVVTHRFDFPLSGTTANQLGQFQFQTTSGTVSSGWQGVPTQYFVKSNGGPRPDNYVPGYGPPGQMLFDPLIDSSGTNPVLAWSGSTPGFPTGDHEQSEFTLFFAPFGLANGDEIEFRFLLATDIATNGTTSLAWEVNKVEIKGVVPCVPEPGGLALVACGGLAALALRLRRRAARAGPVLGSTVAAVIVALVIVAIVCGLPSQATAAVPVADYDFATSGSGLGWTSQTFTSISPTTPMSGSYWDYWLPPSAGNRSWHVAPTLGFAPPSWSVNTLTSPVITVPQNVDLFEFTIRHRFNFPTNITTGRPIVLGQLAWRYYDPGNLSKPFQPFLPSVFATGSVPPPFNALSPDPNWVPSNYVTGTFGVPPLVAGGGGWTGSSPGWATGDFVMSQVTLDGGLTGGQQVQFRFLNAVLGVSCSGAAWDVSRVTVIGQMPEPGGLALAAIGVGSGAVGLVVRRRGRLTSGPPVRS